MCYNFNIRLLEKQSIISDGEKINLPINPTNDPIEDLFKNETGNGIFLLLLLDGNGIENRFLSDRGEKVNEKYKEISL